MDGRVDAIKFVHTADWHLGRRMISLRDSDGYPLQFRWAEDAGNQIADFAADFGADIVFLCGDILNRADPSPTVENILARILRRILSAGAKVVYLLGNHEVPREGDHPAKIYATLGIEGVIVADSAQVYPVELAGGRVLQVVALPYLYGVNPDEVLRELVAQVDPDKPAVVLAHAYVTGAKLSGSDASYVLEGPQISPSTIADLPVDYVALGHIHRHQQVWTNPPAVYPGSIQRVTFAEADEQKGFVAGRIFLDTPRRVQWEFVPVPSVPFVKVEVDLTRSEVSEPVEEILSALKNVPAGAVVKLSVYLPRAISLPLVKIRKLARKSGIYLVAIEIHRVEMEEVAGRSLPRPTGDIVEDISRYVRSARPDLVDELPRIIEVVREFID
ncbi:exonuclease SbcCD subunit D [bacterium]|nr:exonuclease SbcCD subunit D [bacterium]